MKPAENVFIEKKVIEESIFLSSNGKSSHVSTIMSDINLKNEKNKINDIIENQEIKNSLILKQNQVQCEIPRNISFKNYFQLITVFSLISLLIAGLSFGYGNYRIHFFMNYFGLGISIFIFNFMVYKRKFLIKNTSIHLIIFMIDFFISMGFGYMIAYIKIIKKDYVYVLIIPIIAYLINTSLLTCISKLKLKMVIFIIVKSVKK